jgi:hypothetical protein
MTSNNWEPTINHIGRRFGRLDDILDVLDILDILDDFEHFGQFGHFGHFGHLGRFGHFGRFWTIWTTFWTIGRHFPLSMSAMLQYRLQAVLVVTPSLTTIASPFPPPTFAPPLPAINPIVKQSPPPSPTPTINHIGRHLGQLDDILDDWTLQTFWTIGRLRQDMLDDVSSSIPGRRCPSLT